VLYKEESRLSSTRRTFEKMATAYSGTSGPSWWYFGVPIVTCVVVLRGPHPLARHGYPPDLRRKRAIGISKPHGGTSGPLNMLLRWLFETPAPL
jgi:hypothetical protein